MYCRVFLISQDGHELYISVAQADNRWINYIYDIKKTIQKEEFLKIHYYGPWHINKKMDVQQFSKMLLALALRAVAEEDES